MRINKYWLIIGSVISAIILFGIVRVTKEADFENLKRDTVNIPSFDQYEFRKKLHQEIEEDGIEFTKIYSSLSNRFIPTDFTDNYFVIITGVSSIDDGIFLFFTIPIYSRVLVIKRETEKIVANKFFNFGVTNAKIIDGYIYFVYNSRWSEDYQLGRFKFDPKEELAS